MGDPCCWVVGVLESGCDTLTPRARRRVESADLVIGDNRFLKLLNTVISTKAEQRSLPDSSQFTQISDWIKEAWRHGQSVVVLATGDPLFFGIAGFLRDRLPPNSLRILGTVSTLQLAFQRIALPWHNARFLSFHTRKEGRPSLLEALRDSEVIAILTRPGNGPAHIAQELLRMDAGAVVYMHVFERLESHDEQIFCDLTPHQAAEKKFRDPNVVILQKKQNDRCEDPWPVFGLPDLSFLSREISDTFITKREVRAIVLAYLALRSDTILWDIGAGSGSVGLEAARLCPAGAVYAIEKKPVRVQQIQRNQKRLCITNHTVIMDDAPAGLERWPAPNAIFIGGSGGAIEALIITCIQRLLPNGRLVMSFISLENFHTALKTIQQMNLLWRVVQAHISHTQPIAGMHRFVSASPVWVVVVETT